MIIFADRYAPQLTEALDDGSIAISRDYLWSPAQTAWPVNRAFKGRLSVHVAF